MCVCVISLVHRCSYACLCDHVRLKYIHVHTYIHTCVYIHRHTYIHTYTKVHAYHVGKKEYSALLLELIAARVRSVRAFMGMLYTHTYIHTYIHYMTCTHTLEYMHTMRERKIIAVFLELIAARVRSARVCMGMLYTHTYIHT